jgi:hypothetical protein
MTVNRKTASADRLCSGRFHFIAAAMTTAVTHQPAMWRARLSFPAF